MRAIVTVIGVDKTGIIAATSGLLAENDINILDITQTILQDMFTMVMLVDIEKSKIAFGELLQQMEKLGEELGVEIRIQHEDIFKSMHRI